MAEEIKVARKKLRVAIYIRVSSKEQAEMYGAMSQENAIRKYISARDDLEFAGERYVYNDGDGDGVSGVTPMEDRPK